MGREMFDKLIIDGERWRDLPADASITVYEHAGEYLIGAKVVGYLYSYGIPVYNPIGNKVHELSPNARYRKTTATKAEIESVLAKLVPALEISR